MEIKRIDIDSQSYFEITDEILYYQEEEASGNIIDIEMNIKEIKYINFKKKEVIHVGNGCNVFIAYLFAQPVTEIEQSYTLPQIIITYVKDKKLQTLKVINNNLSEKLYKELKSSVFKK